MAAQQREWLWRGREVLSHRRAVGFDHLGAAQEQLFRYSNGFHEFTDSTEMEVVWPKGKEPLLVQEASVVDIAAVQHVPLATERTALAFTPRTQHSREVPALERVEEPVASVVYIKGYDDLVRLKHQATPLTADEDVRYRYAACRILECKAIVTLWKDDFHKDVSDMQQLDSSYRAGWRFLPERSREPQTETP